MFGFLKSSAIKIKIKMFGDDFLVLRDMSVENQLKVYKLIKNDYRSLINLVENDAPDIVDRAKKISKLAMEKRNLASKSWNDKRNPDWMAAAIIEHLSVAILSGDDDAFMKIYLPIGGWVSAIEMIDI
jgi:hypothetical protein